MDSADDAPPHFTFFISACFLIQGQLHVFAYITHSYVYLLLSPVMKRRGHYVIRIDLTTTDSSDNVHRNQVRRSLQRLSPNLSWSTWVFACACVSHMLTTVSPVISESHRKSHSDEGGTHTNHGVDLLSTRTPHGGLQICLSVSVHILSAPPVTAQRGYAVILANTQHTHAPQMFWVSDRTFFTLCQEMVERSVKYVWKEPGRCLRGAVVFASSLHWTMYRSHSHKPACANRCTSTCIRDDNSK